MILGLEIEGFFRFESIADDGERTVHVAKRNAVHKEHMSIAIARALAGEDAGHIYSVHFGTGGATISSTGAITYAEPNVTGASDLHVPTYFELVDTKRGAPEGNLVSYRHVSGLLYSDVVVRATIDKNEPFGQAAFDNDTLNINNDFSFDEVALKTSDGLLLSHVIFAPVIKTSNRVYEAVYELRIRLM